MTTHKTLQKFLRFLIQLEISRKLIQKLLICLKIPKTFASLTICFFLSNANYYYVPKCTYMRKGQYFEELILQFDSDERLKWKKLLWNPFILLFLFLRHRFFNDKYHRENEFFSMVYFSVFFVVVKSVI